MYSDYHTLEKNLCLIKRKKKKEKRQYDIRQKKRIAWKMDKRIQFLRPTESVILPQMYTLEGNQAIDKMCGYLCLSVCEIEKVYLWTY